MNINHIDTESKTLFDLANEQQLNFMTLLKSIIYHSLFMCHLHPTKFIIIYDNMPLRVDDFSLYAFNETLQNIDIYRYQEIYTDEDPVIKKKLTNILSQLKWNTIIKKEWTSLNMTSSGNREDLFLYSPCLKKGNIFSKDEYIWKIINLKGLTLEDFTSAAYRMKSCKYDYAHERWEGIDFDIKKNVVEANITFSYKLSTIDIETYEEYISELGRKYDTLKGDYKTLNEEFHQLQHNFNDYKSWVSQQKNTLLKELSQDYFLK